MAKFNPIMQSIRETTSPEIRRQVDLSVQIANRVYELLEKKNLSQKELAKRLRKTETEVSRWLSGTHNLTIATIAKLSIALDDDIVVTTTSKPNIKTYVYEESEKTMNRIADDSTI